MKKFLLITYYWPPAGGAGVQRWVKFCKYIQEFGWEPVVYTPENPEYPVIDPSLINDLPEGLEVIKRPVWEPYQWFKLLTGKKQNERVYSGFINAKGKKSFAHKLSVFIRGNLFIPDARMFWIRPSVKFLKTYLTKHKVDAIISNGPPHSAHRIALGLKRVFPKLPWVADFRDPWTKIDFYEQLHLTTWGDRRHHRQEQEVLALVDRIVTVSPSWAQDFAELSSRDDIMVITNGYDPDDFRGRDTAFFNKFTICHFGSMNRDRNPYILWRALQELLAELPNLKRDLQIDLYGQVDFEIIQSIQEADLNDYCNKKEFVPHEEVVQIMTKAYVLLLPINNTPNQNGVIPGKLYEYIGAGRPILGIGPEDADAAAIINETSTGVMINYSDLNKLKIFLRQSYENYLKNESLNNSIQRLEKYSRKELARQYASLLSTLTE